MYVRLISDSAREVSQIWVILSRFTSHLSSTIFTTIFSPLSPSIPHRLGWWWRRSCWSRCSFHRLRLLTGATGSRASESCTKTHHCPTCSTTFESTASGATCDTDNICIWKPCQKKGAEVGLVNTREMALMTQIYPTFFGTKQQSDVSSENPHQVLKESMLVPRTVCRRSTPQAWM